MTVANPITPDDVRYLPLFEKLANLINSTTGHNALSATIISRPDGKKVLFIQHDDEFFVVEVASLGKYRRVENDSVLGVELKPVE